MAKTERKIFQPNPLTAMLIEGACDKDKGGTNISDFTNRAILSYYTPYNEALRLKDSAEKFFFPSLPLSQMSFPKVQGLHPA